jgi:thymidylate kinase
MIVIIEGSDFSGKSTVAALLSGLLRERGYTVRRRQGCLTPIANGLAKTLQRWRVPGRGIAFHVIFLLDSLLARNQPNDIVVCEASPIRVAARDQVLRHGFHGRTMLAAQRRYDALADRKYFLDATFETRKKRWENSADRHDRADQTRFGPQRHIHVLTSEALRKLAGAHGYVLVHSTAYTGAEPVTNAILADLEIETCTP